MAEIIDTINALILTCRGSEQGFGKAATRVQNDDLRTRLTGLSLERAKFVDELAHLAEKMGGQPTKSGQASGIPEDLSLEPEENPPEDATFLAEIENGENNTLRDYEQALTLDLPILVRPVLEHQHLAIQEAVAELRSLEQVRKAG